MNSYEILVNISLYWGTSWLSVSNEDGLRIWHSKRHFWLSSLTHSESITHKITGGCQSILLWRVNCFLGPSSWNKVHDKQATSDHGNHTNIENSDWVQEGPTRSLPTQVEIQEVSPTSSDHYRRITVSGDPEGGSLPLFEYIQEWAILPGIWRYLNRISHFSHKKKCQVLPCSWKHLCGHCKPWHPQSPRNSTQCASPILAVCGGQGTKRLQEESPIYRGYWRWCSWIRENMAESISKELLSKTDLWLLLSTSILREASEHGSLTSLIRTVEIWYVFFYVYIRNHILRLLA